MDGDIAEEKRKVTNGDVGKDCAIFIDHLSKSYYSWAKCFSRKEFKAVNKLCLTIDKGQLFCFLGHNGGFFKNKENYKFKQYYIFFT